MNVIDIFMNKYIIVKLKVDLFLLFFYLNNFMNDGILGNSLWLEYCF